MGGFVLRSLAGVENGCKLKTISYKPFETEVDCTGDVCGPGLNALCGSKGLYSTVTWLKPFNFLNTFAQTFIKGTFFGRGAPQDVCYFVRNIIPPALALYAVYKSRDGAVVSPADKKQAWAAALKSVGVMLLATGTVIYQKTFQAGLGIEGDPSGHVMMMMSLAVSTEFAGRAASYNQSPAWLKNTIGGLSLGLGGLSIFMLPNTVACWHTDAEVAMGTIWSGSIAFFTTRMIRLFV